MCESLIIAIIGWAITIAIAVYTVINGAKDTDKKISALIASTNDQITALEESTRKQIESVKELTGIQIKTSIMQIKKELNEAKLHLLIADKKESEIKRMEHNAHILGCSPELFMKKDGEKSNIMHDKDFYLELSKALEKCEKELLALEKKIRRE